MRLISRILVANRGEIARRVFATCRSMGINTVAVYADPDAEHPHVREADAAVRLPGTSPAQTYLRADLILEAARASGADAIHPGYGFLSENADFAQAVIDAGLTWIGPTPHSIQIMGSKIESKRQMADVGIPILSELRPDDVTEADLPVLIKASAGGGGRGMRIVDQLSQLPDQIASAAAEAESAFADATVFCERYIPTGHHIEVQLMADSHGTVWAVGERECSIQRRYQKVVEEAPSPLVQRHDGMRERLLEAARAAARAVDYQGAGTVEFLADENGEFYFLEMNTRLQVEHPVTECTTGLDLVRQQILVAQGAALEPTPPRARGHSIEVRLYAEDPAHDYRPQAGKLHRFHIDSDVHFATLPRPGIRLDSALTSGNEVGTNFDPMIAKVISWAPTRIEAARLLSNSLRRAQVHGVVTNLGSLIRILNHQSFLDGRTSTAFLNDFADDILPDRVTARELMLAAFAATVAEIDGLHQRAHVGSRTPAAWRNVIGGPVLETFRCGEQEIVLSYLYSRSGLRLIGEDDVTVLRCDQNSVMLEIDSVQKRYSISWYGDQAYVTDAEQPIILNRTPRYTDPADQIAEGSLTAPMPGAVLRIAYSVGDRVEAGKPIMWLEAMKMEHQVLAPYSGVIAELPAQTGAQVEVGTILVVLEEESADKESHDE